MMSCRFLPLILLVLVGSSVHAAVVTSRAAFESAINIAYTEDFQTLGPGSVAVNGPIVLPSGLGVSSQGNALFAVGPGQSTNPSQAIGINFPASDSLTFDLAADYTAFGADFFQNRNGGAQFPNDILYRLNFFDNGNLIDSVDASVAPNGGSFIGFTSTNVFDTVEVISTPADSYEIADNVTVGNVKITAIPEPSSMALLVLGSIGLAGVTRRRRRN